MSCLIACFPIGLSGLILSFLREICFRKYRWQALIGAKGVVIVLAIVLASGVSCGKSIESVSLRRKVHDGLESKTRGDEI